MVGLDLGGKCTRQGRQGGGVNRRKSIVGLDLWRGLFIFAGKLRVVPFTCKAKFVSNVLAGKGLGLLVWQSLGRKRT